MNLNKTSREVIFKNYQELEDKIFNKISLDYRFKDILYAFAVLEKDENKILLGSNSEICGKVNYNFNLKYTLENIIVSILGQECIKLELKIDENAFLAVNKRLKEKIAKEKEDKSSLIEIEAQKNAGKCHLIPFPISENKVRSELTIERHALFAANTFKGDFRIYERNIKDHQTGKSFILRVEVGDRTSQVRGVLKQKHQEAFYKLSQLWEQQEYQLVEEDKSFLFGSIELSVYDLVQRLRGDDAGQNYKKVFQLLKEMASIRVNIKKINIEDDTYDVQDFSLLSYEWHAKQFSEKTLRPKSDGESKVNIRFSNFVTDNFLKKNVKSLMLDPYFSLKDKGGKGLAQLLYTMLDYELSSKDKFHISLKNLGERLGLTKYKYKSDRKRQLNVAVLLVNGKTILSGKYEINTNLIDSEDKKDWVLVVRRVSKSQ